MTRRMQAYQFMTQEQQDILDDNWIHDLWEELNEMVEEVTITNQSEWDSFWNEAIKSPWFIIE